MSATDGRAIKSNVRIRNRSRDDVKVTFPSRMQDKDKEFLLVVGGSMRRAHQERDALARDLEHGYDGAHAQILRHTNLASSDTVRHASVHLF